MFDYLEFVNALSRFARQLPHSYRVEDALAELVDSAVDALSLTGGAVSLAAEGSLRNIVSVTGSAHRLERCVERFQSGPCRAAYDLGEVVCVPDVGERADLWPDFAVAARSAGIVAAAGIPMRRGGIETIGSLNLFADERRDWTDEDIGAARTLADVATGYVVNVSKRRQSQELASQLQSTLESRIVVEQAKGIIADHNSIGVDRAFERIRRHAAAHGTPLVEVAHAIVRVGLRV